MERNNKERLYPVRDEETCRCGYKNSEGEWVIAPQYDDVDVFREGVAWVKSGQKWGLIDSCGNKLTEPRYDDMREFNEGFGQVKINGRWGMVDKSGTLVVAPEFDFIRTNREGIATVKKDGKFGFVNISDGIVIPAVYDAVLDFSEGLAAVRTDCWWGFINTRGEMAIEPEWEEVAESFRAGAAEVRKDGYWRCIDIHGCEIPGSRKEVDRDFTCYVSDGEVYDASVKFYHGWIDAQGNYIVRPKFNSIKWLADRTCLVEIDGKWGLVDPSGAYLIEPQSEKLEIEPGINRRESPTAAQMPVEALPDYTNAGFSRILTHNNGGFVGVEIGEGFAGIADLAGRLVVNPEFEMIDCARDAADGVFRVMQNELWGFVNCASGVNIPPKYFYVRPFKSGIAEVIFLEKQLEAELNSELGKTEADREFSPSPDDLPF